MTATGATMWTLPLVLPGFEMIMNSLDDMIYRSLRPSDFARVDKDEICRIIGVNRVPADFQYNPLMSEDADDYLGMNGTSPETDADSGDESDDYSDLDVIRGGMASAFQLNPISDVVIPVVNTANFYIDLCTAGKKSVQNKEQKMAKSNTLDTQARPIPGNHDLCMVELTVDQQMGVAAIACYGLLIKHYNNCSSIHSIASYLDPDVHTSSVVKDWISNKPYFQEHVFQPYVIPLLIGYLFLAHCFVYF